MAIDLRVYLSLRNRIDHAFLPLSPTLRWPFVSLSLQNMSSICFQIYQNEGFQRLDVFLSQSPRFRPVKCHSAYVEFLYIIFFSAAIEFLRIYEHVASTIHAGRHDRWKYVKSSLFIFSLLFVLISFIDLLIMHSCHFNIVFNLSMSSHWLTSVWFLL